MGDRVLGEDWQPVAPSDQHVNISSADLTEQQWAGLTPEQREALDAPTPVDPRSAFYEGEQGERPDDSEPGEQVEAGDPPADPVTPGAHDHLGGPDLGDDPDGDLAGYDGAGAPVLDDMGPEPTWPTPIRQDEEGDQDESA